RWRRTIDGAGRAGTGSSVRTVSLYCRAGRAAALFGSCQIRQRATREGTIVGIQPAGSDRICTGAKGTCGRASRILSLSVKRLLVRAGAVGSGGRSVVATVRASARALMISSNIAVLL